MPGTSQIDLLRCPRCLRRFLIEDVAKASALSCPACEHELELIVRSLPGPASRAASALGAKLLGPLEP